MQRISSKGSTSRWVKGVEVFTIGGQDYVKGSPSNVTAVTRSGVEVGLRVYKPTAEALCQRHKNYQALRKPRTNCEECLEAYARIKNVE